MKTKKLVAYCGTLAVGLGGLVATPAYAQATRTWVSGVGDDVNPCSRTAPCKTFAGAISKTSAGGEINCLDPAGYGAVTITKSITIDCEDTQGSILASATNGINVNDASSGFPNTIRVIIRGLSINGAQTSAQNAQGNPGSGLVGINFLSGAALIVEHVIIQNFNSSTATGIRVNTPAASETFITDTQISDNGTTGAGGGVQVTPTGAGGTARVVITNSRIENNANNGFRIDTTGSTNASGVNATIDGSSVAGNTNGIVVNGPAATSNAEVLLQNSTVSGNSGIGVLASGTLGRVRVGTTGITGNGTGVLAGGGASINTYGNNRLNGNTSDGAFTAPPIAEQ